MTQEQSPLFQEFPEGSSKPEGFDANAAADAIRDASPKHPYAEQEARARAIQEHRGDDLAKEQTGRTSYDFTQNGSRPKTASEPEIEIAEDINSNMPGREKKEDWQQSPTKKRQNLEELKKLRDKRGL